MCRVRTGAIVAVVGAVMALGGCAQGPDAYETAVAEITARHREALERVAKDAERERRATNAGDRRRQAEDRLIAKVREPLSRFLAETPRSCASQNLADAAGGPPALAARTQRSGADTGTLFLRRVGAAMLDVADAAQQAGCTAAARQIYEDARRTFAGPDHAELQLRAQFAIAYLTRTAEKWMPSPAHTASVPTRGASAEGR
jgi:hypothetical protein